MFPERCFLVWDCKGRHFFLQSKFFLHFLQKKLQFERLFIIPLLQKHEKDSHDKTEKGCEMIPLDRLPFEKKGDDHSEYRQ